MAGWRVREALAHELDLGVSLAMSESLRPLFASLQEAVEHLPPAWFDQGRALFAGLEGDVSIVVGRLASALDRVEETDYAALTLALREATKADVEASARAVAARHGIDLGDARGPEAVLFALSAACEARAGHERVPDTAGHRRLRRECRIALSACRDSDVATRFWYWLDQFHHQVYGAWRAGRAEFLASERRRAAAALGGLEGPGVPALDWLPFNSGLRSLSPTHEQVVAGAVSVIFHVEPFGIWDTRFGVPGAVLAGFGQPGELYAAFRARAEQISSRLKALADPTRLTMLRVVRGGEVDNSDVAAHLDLSHPTVSVHARLLREAHLATSRRDGRRLLHALDVEGVRSLLREVESFLGLRAADDGTTGAEPP